MSTKTPTADNEFQSRSGFSGCRDASSKLPASVTDIGFNPVLGFLGVATDDLGIEEIVVDAVSIPFWVFWVSRLIHRVPLLGVDPVSIPFWVFWVSRRYSGPSKGYPQLCFNPVLGFLGVATTLKYSRPVVSVSFNPVLGFLGVATEITKSISEKAERFQSRSGFSGCRDVTR